MGHAPGCVQIPRGISLRHVQRTAVETSLPLVAPATRKSTTRAAAGATDVYSASASRGASRGMRMARASMARCFPIEDHKIHQARTRMRSLPQLQ